MAGLGSECSLRASPSVFLLADIVPFRKPRRPQETFKKVGIPIIAVLLSLIALVIVALLSELQPPHSFHPTPLPYNIYCLLMLV